MTRFTKPTLLAGALATAFLIAPSLASAAPAPDHGRSARYEQSLRHDNRAPAKDHAVRKPEVRQQARNDWRGKGWQRVAHRDGPRGEHACAYKGHGKHFWHERRERDRR